MWQVAIENSKAKTPREMAERLLNKTRPGDIILLHDGIPDRSKTVQALSLLVDGLKEKGYRATTAGELLKQADPR